MFDNWRAVTDYARAELAGQMTEQARTLYLDGRNQLISEKIQEGTVDTAPLYPREVVRGALEAGASALILIHNHPSGDPTPASADISVTRVVVEAAKVFDISVHDHLIVGRGEVFSMRGRGLL
ncbi:MAG: hypothetical protein BGO24_06015 [Sphingomonas sp. 67-36]|nr:hypothetical protein [Sphingomonas sp.]OJV28617.1 MAG: hypothetical protein BGO24_06015 [Sphingomonas sp. 67-36]